MKKKWLKSSWVLFWLGISGIMSTIVMELGWMLTELGRQPWAVRGYVKTEDAFTTSGGVTTFGYLFPIAYVLLAIVTVLAIKRIVANNSQKGTK